MKPLRVHPIAKLFPRIEGAEYAQLREDIRVHGVREPAWVWDEPGKEFTWLIDGQNRQAICKDLGIDLPTRQWSGEGSLVEFAVSLNLHRRQLTKSQLAMLVQELIPLLEKEARKRQGHGQTTTGRALVANLPQAPKVREQAAKLVGISARSVQDGKAVKSKGHKKVVEAVTSGKVSVSDAKRVVDLPVEEQIIALRKVEEKAAKTLAAAVESDDCEAALTRGVSKLKSARKLFAKCACRFAAVLKHLDKALECAAEAESN